MLDDIQKAEAERQLAHRAADLERDLAAVQHARRNAEKVCADALAARNRAEKDRDTARAENAELREALEFYASRKHELEVLETDDCSDTGAYGLRAREALGTIQ